MTPTGGNVNRDAQKNMLIMALNYIAHIGPLFQTIFEFFGIPRIGKTTVIELLVQECREQGILHALIDFGAQGLAATYLASPGRLVLDLARQLGVDEWLGDLQSVEGPGNVGQLASQFVDLVSERAQAKPVVLFFDSSDQAHPGTLATLEEEIVGRLALSGHVLFVFAGRTPLHWRRIEIRRRVRSEKLAPIKPEFVAALLERAGLHARLSEFSDAIFRLTRGLPEGIEVAGKRIAQWLAEGATLEGKNLGGRDAELVQVLMEEVIDKHFFQGREPAHVAAIQVLSLVRQFDTIMLRRLLQAGVPAFSPDQFPKNAFGALLGTLGGTHLLEYNEERIGYCVEPTLRHILSQYIYLTDPDQYAQIHQVALDVYEDWIKKAPPVLDAYIVEALYHKACLAIQGHVEYDLYKMLEEYKACCPVNDSEALDAKILQLEEELRDVGALI